MINEEWLSAVDKTGPEAVDKTGEVIAKWQQLSVGGVDDEEEELACEEEWRFVVQDRVAE